MLYVIAINLIFMFGQCVKAAPSMIVDQQTEVPFPGRVKQLLQWPGKEIKNKSLVSDQNQEINRERREHCIRWIKKTMNPVWLPTDEYFNQNLLILQESNQIITGRIKWVKNDFIIQISQTLCIMTIQFTPVHKTQEVLSKEGKIDFMKQLSLRVFNDTGYIRSQDPNGFKHVPVKELPQKIVEDSFPSGNIKEYADGVAGHSNNPYRPERSNNNLEITKKLEDAGKKETRISYAYWWRDIRWWYKNNDFGFYLLKKEAGPFKLDYNSLLDTQW